MGQSLKKFAASMRARAAKVPEIGNKLAIAGTEAMLRGVIAETRVDTSEAVSNWMISIGAPSNDRRMPHVLGSRGSSRGPSSAKSISEGLEVLFRKQSGQTVYLSNTVDYIKIIDDGFIPTALIQFRLAVQDAKKDIWR